MAGRHSFFPLPPQILIYLFFSILTLWFDLHRHLFLLVLLFFFVAAITIRRWKCKRVPVTIVSTQSSTTPNRMTHRQTISMRVFRHAPPSSCCMPVALVLCGLMTPWLLKLLPDVSEVYFRAPPNSNQLNEKRPKKKKNGFAVAVLFT